MKFRFAKFQRSLKVANPPLGRISNTFRDESVLRTNSENITFATCPIPNGTGIEYSSEHLERGVGGSGSPTKFCINFAGLVPIQITNFSGAVAQLEEHHVRNVGAEGSNPFCSTNNL